MQSSFFCATASRARTRSFSSTISGMRSRHTQPWVALVIVIAVAALPAPAQSPAASSSSSKPRASQKARTMEHADSSLDPGTVKDNGYRNVALGLSCKIPQGWVLRTEEMNEDDAHGTSEPQGTRRDTEERRGRVLLGAFSRPPEARGEDVNASIVIAAESAASYPGLKDAAQYFGPLTEVIQAQGFKVVEEPYEFPVGTKRLPRSDFQKDVGTRVTRQATLVMLARGYVVSFTFIAASEDDVEELVDGLSFGAGGKGVP